MSDYKVVATTVEMTERALIIKALESMLGKVEENVVAKQRWESHNREVDICIRQSQLPDHLKGFGDVGLVQRGGKFEFLGCSESDSSYMDRDKRSALVAGGMSAQDAIRAQPDGKFTADLNEMFQKVENGYALFKKVRDIKRKCPSSTFSVVSGVKGDNMAWKIRGSVSASDLARAGIRV
jgi:hypothetical protein